MKSIYCHYTSLVITYCLRNIENKHKYHSINVPQYIIIAFCILHLKLGALFTFLRTNAILAFR